MTQNATLATDTLRMSLYGEWITRDDTRSGTPDPKLITAREGEILGLMAAGMTNPQIAAQLVIGAGTVKTHTLNIYRKLDVANRTQAVVRAQELALVPSNKAKSTIW
jgi:ATP/maltotriose-dependent transcriptional regulator MalT